MASAKAAKEPSMEDILASIRQIIADDDKPGESPKVEEPAMQDQDQAAIDDVFATADVGDEDGADDMAVDDIDALFDEAGMDDDDDDDVLALTAEQSVESEELSQDDLDDISFDAPAGDDDPMAAALEDAGADENSIEVDIDEQPIVAPKPTPVPVAAPAPAVAAPSMGDMEALVSDAAASSIKSSFGALNSAMTVSGQNTIEDLMCTMLRPMLKSWLDENLPPMVERMVQAEIERMRG